MPTIPPLWSTGGSGSESLNRGRFATPSDMVHPASEDVMPPINVLVPYSVASGVVGRVPGSPSPSLGDFTHVSGALAQLRSRGVSGFTHHVVSADVHDVPKSVSSFDPTSLLFPFSDSGFSSRSSLPPFSSQSSLPVTSAAPLTSVPLLSLPAVVPSVLPLSASVSAPSSAIPLFFSPLGLPLPPGVSFLLLCQLLLLSLLWLLLRCQPSPRLWLRLLLLRLRALLSSLLAPFLRLQPLPPGSLLLPPLPLTILLRFRLVFWGCPLSIRHLLVGLPRPGLVISLRISPLIFLTFTLTIDLTFLLAPIFSLPCPLLLLLPLRSPLHLLLCLLFGLQPLRSLLRCLHLLSLLPLAPLSLLFLDFLFLRLLRSPLSPRSLRTLLLLSLFLLPLLLSPLALHASGLGLRVYPRGLLFRGVPGPSGVARSLAVHGRSSAPPLFCLLASVTSSSALVSFALPPLSSSSFQSFSSYSSAAPPDSSSAFSFGLQEDLPEDSPPNALPRSFTPPPSAPPEAARSEFRQMMSFNVNLFPQAAGSPSVPPPPSALFKDFFGASAPSPSPIFLNWFERVRSALADADSCLASFVASSHGNYLFLPSRAFTYAVHGDFVFGGAAPVSSSLLSLFERCLKPMHHVGLTIREAAALEASFWSQSEALSHSMWVLSVLLGFVRLQNFAPEDLSLFNILVTSLS